MSDAETIAVLAAVLAAHRPCMDQTAVEDGTCLARSCDFEGDGETESFAAHQAAALEPAIREAKREAWDEGVEAHRTWAFGQVVHAPANPYDTKEGA